GEVEVEGEDKDHQQDASTTLSGNFAIGDVSLSNLKTNSGYLYKYVRLAQGKFLHQMQETMHSDNEREVDSDGLSVLESDVFSGMHSGSKNWTQEELTILLKYIFRKINTRKEGPGTISSQLVTILKRIITDD
ncbi:7957_t:CDS:2, partial [Entrophospora sp. SA101]